MKKILLVVFGGLLLLGLGGFLYMSTASDLRTSAMKSGVTKAMEAKGRALLSASIESLGGMKRWREHKKRIVRVEMRDTWRDNLFTKVMIPGDLSGHPLAMVFRPAENHSRLLFLGGKRKGTSWGIQQWATYTVNQSGAMDWKKDDHIKFLLPTYQYFLYMPFYLAEAPKIAFAGERSFNGWIYDLVLATWKSYEPQRAIDQYLIWIERKSKRIEYVQFTVRDMFARILSTSKAESYKRVDGLLLPHRWKILPKLGDPKWMHKIEVSSIRKEKQLKPSYLIPDPKRKEDK